MQLSAVVTTGIYCRPGCPARPNARNVVSYSWPAAAEADGFRACLRCRPYREAPGSVWDIGPELVCRAVQLISAGALDGGTEDNLGARLGVSARHLRRLFRDSVGVTPDQVARSRRAHFARRLLDDTDLPVADVAFASGFGSVRQFHRSCLSVFHATPGELRSRRRSGDRLVADGGLTLRLPYTGSLDLDAMLAWLAPRAIPGVEHVDQEAGVYRRTIDVGGDPGVLEIRSGGEAQHLEVRAHLPHWEGLIHVVERIRRLFGLDGRPEAADALRRDPVIGPLVAARAGLRVPGAWDGFEVAVRTIVGQQVSVAGATTLAGRLVERLGRPVPGLGPLGLSATFPSPEVVASGHLDGLGLTPGRVGALRAVAGAVADGTVRLDGSVGLGPLAASLEALPGIGPWTAQYVALRLGESDAFPSGDLGLRNSYARLVPSASAADLVSASERWRPWRALAAIHLWTAATQSAFPRASGA